MHNRKGTGNSKPPLQRDERPHTDRTHVHIPTVHTSTHKILRVRDKERGTKRKVARKANVIERVGYAVCVKFEKVLTTRNKCPGL